MTFKEHFIISETLIKLWKAGTMRKRESEEYYSKIADYYFNTTRYLKIYRGQLSGSYIVHDEIEKLCKKGIRRILIDELRRIVTSAYPERDELEGRVDKVIEFSIKPRKGKTEHPLLEKHGDYIIIL